MLSILLSWIGFNWIQVDFINARGERVTGVPVNRLWTWLTFLGVCLLIDTVLLCMIYNWYIMEVL